MNNNKSKMLVILIISSVFISLNLFSQNSAPVVVNDTIYMDFGETRTISPLNNDYDIDGDQFLPRYASFSAGTVELYGSNLEVKISNTNRLLFDSIKYTLIDQHGAISEPGYIYVNIAPGKILDTLNINNVSASFKAGGTDFYNSYTNYQYENGFVVPIGNNLQTIFASELWMGGHTDQNILHSSSRYYYDVDDYMYGPISDAKGDRDAHDVKFNRVWKVSKYQIEKHIFHYSNPLYIMPEVIKNWPAHGDISKGQAYNLAPFVDFNGDGKYNPEYGDYPEIRGHQCVLVIMNDNVIRNGFNDKALTVDVLQMSYAYNCSEDTALNNTIFMHYDIFNRSQNTYKDFIIGNFYDYKLGNPSDDYRGCDTLRNIFYVYNKSNSDYDYGDYPPALGVKILNQSLSSYNMFYKKPGHNFGEWPRTSKELYNNLSGKFNDGTSITVGAGGQSGTEETKFYYPGDIHNSTQWSEVSAGNSGTSVSVLGNIGPFKFVPNQKISFDVAIIYARGVGKTNFENVDLLLQQSDYIQDVYDGVITPECITTMQYEIDKPETGFVVYPNPTNENISINAKFKIKNAEYKIYSITGQLVKNGFLREGTESISVNNLQSGMYFISITNGERTYSQKFIVSGN